MKDCLCLFFFICIGFCVDAQHDSQKNKVKEPLLKFESYEEVKKKIKPQTHFFGIFKGRVNNHAAQLSFDERIYQGQLYLVLTMNYFEKNKIYQGVTLINANPYRLTDVILLDKNGNIEIIEDLFLHNYNRNYISIVFGRGQVAYFSKKKERLEVDFPTKTFKDITQFQGKFKGRLDGRPASLEIRFWDDKYHFTLTDAEQNYEYKSIMDEFPVSDKSFILENIILKSTAGNKTIAIEKLALSTKTSDLLSGRFLQNGKQAGLFFLKQK